MKLCVGIPTIQLHRANAMLGMLSSSTALPDAVAVMSSNIDVSQCLRDARCINRRTSVTVLEDRQGVNPWWNTAMQSALGYGTDWLLVLNDDVLFGPGFISAFKHALEGASYDLVYPRTTGRLSSYMKYEDTHKAAFAPATKRQGCAFAMSKGFMQRMEPIPCELAYFYGDDWIYAQASSVAVCKNVLLYHEVGGTTKQDVDRFRAIRKAESKVYRRIMKDRVAQEAVAKEMADA